VEGSCLCSRLPLPLDAAQRRVADANGVSVRRSPLDDRTRGRERAVSEECRHLCKEKRATGLRLEAHVRASLDQGRDSGPVHWLGWLNEASCRDKRTWDRLVLKLDADW
jgi:hypothetical protein